MKLTPSFMTNDFQKYRTINPSIQFKVDDFRFQAIGGPYSAVISARGKIVDLWSLVTLLRSPVKIHNENGQVVWWGFINAVEIFTDRISYLTSLDKMVNKVKVVYSDVGKAGTIGEKTETAWVSDTISINRYGTKEGIYSLNSGSAEQALNYANSILARYKMPVSTIRIAQGEGARISCSGWFQTLGWKYYSSTAGLEGYETAGVGVQAFGDQAATTMVAQSFQLGSVENWEAIGLAVKIAKTGNPVDNLTVQISSDNAGVPGSYIIGSYVNGATLTNSYTWVNFPFSPYSLQTGTTYWVQAIRWGANDAANYYRIDTNESLGYTRGSFKIWNGSNWVARSPDSDMLFLVVGERDTGKQMVDVISGVGQFLSTTNIRLDSDSGVASIPYQDGSRTGLDVILELIKTGTSDNRRMLVEITESRFVRVYKEPEFVRYIFTNLVREHRLRKDGKLYTHLGIPIRMDQYRAGIWARLVDAFPFSYSMEVVEPGVLFVEEAGYSNGVGFIRPRDESALLEVGE